MSTKTKPKSFGSRNAPKRTGRTLLRPALSTKKAENVFTAAYEQTEDGWWVATLLEIPGVFSQGKTLEEAREYLQDAAKLMMEEYRAEARKEIDDSAVMEEILVALP